MIGKNMKVKSEKCFDHIKLNLHFVYSSWKINTECVGDHGCLE